MDISKYNILSILSILAVGSAVMFCVEPAPIQVTPIIANYSKSASLELTTLLFNETFEGENPFSGTHSIEAGDWDYALQYVTNPVYCGSKSARFEIRENQPLVKNGKRAEVTIFKGLPGKNMWYSFAVYFPSDGFSKDSKRDAISQWHQGGSPSTSLRVQHDRIILETGFETENRKQIDIGFVTKNTWHEFVFHIIHSHESDGLIEVWHNRKKVITNSGGNLYDDVLPKWKIGISKSAFKHGTSNVKKRVLFFDNVKVGNEKTTYNDMIPCKDHEHSLPNLNSTNLLFSETFEREESFSGAHRIETGYWDYALQYVTNPVHRGSKSARFEIREDQPLVKNGKRAEVTIIKGLPTNNMWYSFAIYFPSEGFSKDSKREAINQWYQHGSPATSLRVQHDRIFLETGSEMENRKPIDIGFVEKDSWHEFVFHFIHSHEREGLIEVWHNGNRVIEHKGGNMYDDVLPKWKIGIYKSSFKYGTSDVKKRVLFVDNIKVGNEFASYEDMIPSKDSGQSF